MSTRVLFFRTIPVKHVGMLFLYKIVYNMCSIYFKDCNGKNDTSETFFRSWYNHRSPTKMSIIKKNVILIKKSHCKITVTTYEDGVFIRIFI